MLKFIAGSLDQLCSEFSRSNLCFISRRNYTSVMFYKIVRGPNIRSLNKKSVFPELWAVSTRNCYNIQPASGMLPSWSTDILAVETMADSQRPAASHVSQGGVFKVEPTMHNMAPEEERQMANRRRYISNGSIDLRPWEPVNKQMGKSSGDSFKFKLLSYNVLAQYLLEVHPYLYRQCASHCLKWQYRSMLLLDEITKLSPDILCLQEVQASHIPTFYKKLEELGYTGIFKQKTGERQDGCAVYYKESMFELNDYISVEFYQPELPILNRDNVGVALKLIPRNSPESPFIVATTHLLFNPKRTDVRLAQMQIFLAEIDRLSFSATKGSGHLPIILTGDLNSMPDSAVVSLLSDGFVRASQYRDGSDWKRIGVTDNCQHLAVYLNRQHGQERRVGPNKLMIHNSDHRVSKKPRLEKEMMENNYLFNTDTVGHSLKLKSVYDYRKMNGHTEATTFQNGWIAVDYIFYNQNGLNVLERLYLPTVKECETLGCLPNDLFGSDHLALGAVFELNSVTAKL